MDTTPHDAHEVRRATPADAALLARLLWDFNTEFETEVDPVDVLTTRFARLLARDDVLALLAGEDGADYRMLCYIGPTEDPTS